MSSSAAGGDGGQAALWRSSDSWEDKAWRHGRIPCAVPQTRRTPYIPRILSTATISIFISISISISISITIGATKVWTFQK